MAGEMTWLPYLAITLLLLSGCTKQDLPKYVVWGHKQKDGSIVMNKPEQTTAYDDVPVVVIYDSGTFLWDGKKWVEK